MVRRVLAVTAVVALLSLSACTTSSPPGGLTATVPNGAAAQQIADVVTQKMAEWHVRAAIVKVTRGSETVMKQAFGPRWTASPQPPP